MNNNTTAAWRQYEAGAEHLRCIGLYDKVRRNERYYRGDQWHGEYPPELIKPVFNIVRRIADYLICTVASDNVSIRYTDDELPYTESAAERRMLIKGTELLTSHAAYRWEHEKLDSTVYRLLLDAFLSGDGVLYCRWDPDIRTGQPFFGDIVTQRIDNTELFVSDASRADIQAQDYIILSGRESVSALRLEAERYGVARSDIKRILPDSVSRRTEPELSDTDSEKATCLIKLYKVNGKVVIEKSTRECVIRRVETNMRLYPVCYFNWLPTKGCFYGTSPVTEMIPNQRYINRAYAMIMKHMTDTAFSKIIYDKTRIPEWTNEVGEAIAAIGSGNISDAVSVVGVGEMQNGYLQLIENAVSNTKELFGATETALGDKDPTNTSAILALQEAARIPLMQVRASFIRCIEELAAIWADMILCFYPDNRLLPCKSENKITAEAFEYSRLHDALINAHVEIGSIDRTTPITTQVILDRLLSEGHILPETYLSLLPSGAVRDRERLIRAVKQDGEKKRKEVPFEKRSNDKNT